MIFSLLAFLTLIISVCMRERKKVFNNSVDKLLV